MGFLSGLIIGGIAASAGWFFVWRNNKDLIKKQAEKLDKLYSDKVEKKEPLKP